MGKFFSRGLIPLFVIPYGIAAVLSVIWSLGVYFLPLDCEDMLSVLYQGINIVIYILLFYTAGVLWHYVFARRGGLIVAVYTAIASLLPLFSYICEYVILLDYLSSSELGEMLIQAIMRCLTLLIYALVMVLSPLAVKLAYRLMHREPKRAVIITALVSFAAMCAQGVLTELSSGADADTVTDILIFAVMYLLLNAFAVLCAVMTAKRQNTARREND